MDLRDIRVIERGEHLRFTTESRKTIRIVGDRGQQHFDRNVAIQFRIARAIDLAHSADPEGRENVVGAEAGAGGQRDGRSIGQ